MLLIDTYLKSQSSCVRGANNLKLVGEAYLVGFNGCHFSVDVMMSIV